MGGLTNLMIENCSGSVRLLKSFILECVAPILSGNSTVLSISSLCLYSVVGSAGETLVNARGATSDDLARPTHSSALSLWAPGTGP
jgi:hypothetical protein